MPELNGPAVAPAAFRPGERVVPRGTPQAGSDSGKELSEVDSMKRIAAVLFLITLSFTAAAQTNDPQALYKLGREAMTRGEPEKAVEYLEKAAALKPNNADYHYQLGVAYSQAGMRAGMF